MQLHIHNNTISSFWFKSTLLLFLLSFFLPQHSSDALLEDALIIVGHIRLAVERSHIMYGIIIIAILALIVIAILPVLDHIVLQ